MGRTNAGSQEAALECLRLRGDERWTCPRRVGARGRWTRHGRRMRSGIMTRWVKATALSVSILAFPAGNALAAEGPAKSQPAAAPDRPAVPPGMVLVDKQVLQQMVHDEVQRQIKEIVAHEQATARARQEAARPS